MTLTPPPGPRGHMPLVLHDRFVVNYMGPPRTAEFCPASRPLLHPEVITL